MLNTPPPGTAEHIMAVTYKWQSIGFGRLGVAEYLPAELLVESGGRGEPFLPAHLPSVLLPDVLGSTPWLLEIDSERVTWCMGYPRGKEDQYCLRWDYRRPAEFVNANLGRDVDLVSPTDRVLP